MYQTNNYQPMLTESEYKNAPHNFMHCMNTECAHSNECLRHQAMQYITPQKASLHILTPALYAENKENCGFFLPEAKLRYAMGITRLLNSLPYHLSVEINNHLARYFRKTTYYRIRNKERLITPSEQEYIRQLFISKGIKEEPIFDEYVNKYDWRT